MAALSVRITRRSRLPHDHQGAGVALTPVRMVSPYVPLCYGLLFPLHFGFHVLIYEPYDEC
jgi:hypothetical protein